jgi:hypothetical protein
VQYVQWIFAHLAAHTFFGSWQKMLSVPKAPPEPSPIAFARAKRAELIRLASSNLATTVPNLSRFPAGERLIVSLPVIRYEHRLNHLVYAPASRERRSIVWYPRMPSERPLTISYVDRGALTLTSRRVIYESAARRQEFPLDELTHVSSTSAGIALGARRGRICYFRGIAETTINFAAPRVGGTPREYSWKLHGEDLEYVLYLLRTGSPSRTSPSLTS